MRIDKTKRGFKRLIDDLKIRADASATGGGGSVKKSGRAVPSHIPMNVFTCQYCSEVSCLSIRVHEAKSYRSIVN